MSYGDAKRAEPLTEGLFPSKQNASLKTENFNFDKLEMKHRGAV